MSAKHFVAEHHFVEAALESLLIEIAFKPYGDRHVVPAAALALQLLEKPEPLLRERQLQLTALGQPLDGSLGRGDARPQLSLNPTGEPGYGRPFKERPQRQLHPAQVAQTVDHL